MIFQLSIVFHIFGFTMLIAGLFLGLRAARMKNPPRELLKSIRFGYLLAGVSLVLLTGFYQIFFHGFPLYFSQGWFHGKFTAALMLVALSAFLFTKFDQVERSGTPLSRRFTSICHAIVGLLFLATLVLVILGRPGLI